MKKMRLGLLLCIVTSNQILSAFEVDGIIYEPYGQYAAVTGMADSYVGVAEIPETVTYANTEFTVISIADNAFKSNQNFYEIKLPNTITKIGSNAFNSCIYLSEITIPSSVTSIGDCAFTGCANLKRVYFNDGDLPLSIGHGEFYNGSGYLQKYYRSFFGGLLYAYIGRNITYDGVTNNGSGYYEYFNGVAISSEIVLIGNMVTTMSQNEFSSKVAIFSSNIPIPYSKKTYSYVSPSYPFYANIICASEENLQTYKNTWTSEDNDFTFLPSADVIFTDGYNENEYRKELDKYNKEQITSIAFYSSKLNSSLTKEIIQQNINPNCLFYLPSNTEINGTNIVNWESGTAEKIKLYNGYNFKNIMNIETKNLDYQLSCSLWADGTKGWENITLPFSPTSIEASESGSIVPITTGSKGNFWLRQYVGSSDDAVYFASTSDGVMHANTPYLIAFPGNSMGAGSLEGQTITFKAKNVTIPVTTQPSIQKNNFTFVGNYDNTADEGEGWVLNAEGSAFVKSSTVGDKPFSGYFKCELPDASSAPSLRMGFGQFDNATGLEMLTTDLVDFQNEDAYTLDGRKIKASNLKAGLYIINNKKVMIR